MATRLSDAPTILREPFLVSCAADVVAAAASDVAVTICVIVALASDIVSSRS